MAAITAWTLTHKRLVLLLWILITVAGAAASGPAYKAMSDQYSVPGNEGSAANARIAGLYGNGGDSAPMEAVVTVPRGSTVTAPPALAAVKEIESRISRAVPGARIASYASTGDRAFVSRDGRTTFVVAYPPIVPGSYGQNPQAVRAATAALRGLTVEGAPVHVTGLDALVMNTGDSAGAGLAVEALLAALAALVVLAFVFGSFLAIVPLLTAVPSIMGCFLVVWPLTGLTSVSTLVSIIIGLVGLGVAIDYSLLVVARWREERSQGHSGDDAVLRAMSTAGRAVVLSGTTVAVGLLSLVVLPVPFLRSVGYAGMLIPLVSVLAAITLLPLILATAGPRLDWPHRRSDARASRAWTRWARLVVRRRWAAGLAGLAILLFLTGAATTMNLGASTGNPDTLAQRGDARTGLLALEHAGFGVGALSPIEILTTPADAGALAARTSGVAPASWHRDGHAVVDVYTHAAGIAPIRTAAHRVAPHARVGGIGAQDEGFTDAVYGSFPLMVAILSLITFLFLARAFRSLLLPIKAIALNVLSIAAAWGVLTLVWQKGYGSHALWGVPATGSIPSWLPLIVFAFLFGLSMDYEVFILARMREEYDRTGSTDTAVVTGMGRTGRLVTSAALILFFSFVAMATAPGAQMMATGFGAGILLDATVVRALLVPAAVSLLGRWNWYLPDRAARLLRIPRPEPLPEG
jgi:putative drug exporter of the RND superfamily